MVPNDRTRYSGHKIKYHLNVRKKGFFGAFLLLLFVCLFGLGFFAVRMIKRWHKLPGEAVDILETNQM